jgi:hypothetical protein
MMHGIWPEYEIDHVNRIKSDNRLCNLRPATRAQNAQNMPVRSNNTSKRTGVNWNKANQNWVASICVNKARISLGSYTDFNDAVLARTSAETRFHTHRHPDNRIEE